MKKSCPAGSSINSASACRQAADSYDSYDYAFSGRWPRHRRGCFIYWNKKVYFNEGGQPAPQNSWSICTKTGSNYYYF